MSKLEDFKAQPAPYAPKRQFQELQPDTSITHHCKIHGDFHPLIVSHPICPECGMKVIEAERLEEKRRWQEQSDKEWYAAANLPILHQTSGFKNYLTDLDGQIYAKSVAKAYAKKLQAGHSGNLVILGTTGTGKTHLACAIARTLMHLSGTAKPIFTKYAISAEVVEDVLNAYKRKDDSKEGTLQRYASYGLLIIDEYGLDDNNNDAQTQALHRVLYERYNAKRPTIIISNKTIADLKEQLGHRALSRLRENGTLLRCVWADQRATNSAWVE